MSDPVRPWRSRGAFRADPFTALEALQDRLNRTFSYAFGNERGQGSWHPDVDVEESEDGWVVEVRLPGVAPDEVSVEVTDRELYVRSRTAEADVDVPAEPAPGVTRSRRSASFSYRLSLPSEVDPERIDATMDHGLLTVQLPRSTKPRSRKIEVGRRPGQVIEADQSADPGADQSAGQGTDPGTGQGTDPGDGRSAGSDPEVVAQRDAVRGEPRDAQLD